MGKYRDNADDFLWVSVSCAPVITRAYLGNILPAAKIVQKEYYPGITLLFQGHNIGFEWNFPTIQKSVWLDHDYIFRTGLIRRRSYS